MGTGYTRNDTSNNIADGNIINAADLDGEFDAIESAFGTSGHTHDGTSAEGGPITVLGPVQDFVASATEIKPKTTNTLDIGTSGLLFKDMFLDGVATIGSIKIDNAGTIGSASDGDAIAISSGGVVSFSQNTIGKTGSGYVLSLQTSDTTIEATNVLGKIEFSAPDEASGTDAILVGASIEALAEDTFDSSTNSTALVFKTNTTGAATERMRVKSDGDVVFNGASYDMTWDTSANALTFADNAKAIFGAGSDLQIYHDGSNSIINEQGDGDLLIYANNLALLSSSNSEYFLQAATNGAVSIRYDNSIKLATTNTGVDITGTLTSDGLTVDGTAKATNTVQITGGATFPASGAGMELSYSSGSIIRSYDRTGSSYQPFSIRTGVFDIQTNGAKRAEISTNGDISFYEDTGTTAKFFWDASAESLGIGTTSPSSKLHISGTYDTILDGNSVQFTRAGPSYIQNNTAGGYTVFQQASGEAMRIDSSGNLLVGKTSASSTSTGAELRPTGQAILVADGTNPILMNRQTSDGDIAVFRKDGTTVGSIGSRAGVVSYIALDPRSGGAGLTGGQALIYPSNNTGGITDGATDLGGSGGRFKDLYLSGTAYVDTAVEIHAGNSLKLQNVAGNGFATIQNSGAGTNTDLAFSTAGSEAMRIDSSGNVGIGTTSIGSPFVVSTSFDTGYLAQFVNTGTGSDANGVLIKGGVDASDYTLRLQDQAGTEILSAKADGKVGIGTSSPNRLLSLYATQPVFQITNVASGNTFGTIQYQVSGSTQFNIDNQGSGSGGVIAFMQAGSERMRIDSSGNLLVGETTPVNNGDITLARSATDANISLLSRSTTDSQGCAIQMQKSSTNSGNFAATADGENLGAIVFRGVNTSAVSKEGAQITVIQDGTNASTVPAAMKFATGGTERMRIISQGALQVSDTGSYRTWSSNITGNQFIRGDAGQVVLTADATSTGYTNDVMRSLCNRSSSSSYEFLTCTSGNLGDDEFRLRGDGQAYADGSWNGGGADYAEYFEWADGNATDEDRVGFTVVLDGNQIRKATSSDDALSIIGAVSANPSVVGDVDIGAWKHKYLRDDFGRYIRDTHNVVEWTETVSEEDGQEREVKHSYEDWNIPSDVTVPDDAITSSHDEDGKPYTHRRLNPDYDPDRSYISREDRPEWATIGMMGKLRILKGQPTGSNWIKMRDVSDTAEEWLVR